MVERAISGLRSDWPSDLQIQLDVAGALPPVHCDPLQIEIMIEQLLKNAAEANAGVGTVSVFLSPHSEGIEVAVSDEGAGIEDELLDQVFDPFVSESDEEAPGGLGLPVCFRIVEEHGGELRFQPSEDGGARVAFVLPVE
jgi:signal transduction histidine kinase